MAVNIQRIANVELIRGATAEPATRLDLPSHRVMISTTVIPGPQALAMRRFFAARFVYATAHDRRNSLGATHLKNAQAAEMPVSLGEVRRVVEREFNENRWRRSERHTPPRGRLCGVPLSDGNPNGNYRFQRRDCSTHCNIVPVAARGSLELGGTVVQCAELAGSTAR
jgi:hypothetical protein